MEHVIERGRDTLAKIRRILSKPEIRFCLPASMDAIARGERCFWHGFGDVDWSFGGRFKLTENLYDSDIALIAHIGENYSGWRQFAGRRGFDGLTCMWLQDNHLAHDNNRASVREADVYVCCHAGHTDYLLNGSAIAGPLLPACFRADPAEDLGYLRKHFDVARLSRVVSPYFMYDWSVRTAFLYDIRRNCPEFSCFYTESNKRYEEYYDVVSVDERRSRWLLFKSSIVVPMNMDLSTRVFDGLFWGHTLMVPDDLPAYDAAFTPEQTAALGIVRYPMNGAFDVLSARARKALAAFDAAGPDGALRRNRFIRSGHLLGHRVRDFLAFLSDLAEGRCPVSFVQRATTQGFVACYPDRPALVDTTLSPDALEPVW